MEQTAEAGDRAQAPDEGRERRPAPAPRPASPQRPAAPPRPMQLQALEVAGRPAEVPVDPQNPMPGDAQRAQANELRGTTARGGPAAPSRPPAQAARPRRESAQQVEERQPWESHRLRSRVAAEPTEITAAQRANYALGFDRSAVDAMLQRLDFTRSHRRGVFTREATAAIRAFQGSHGLRGGTLPGAEGAREEGGESRPAPASGVVDEATVVALDLGALHARRLRNQGSRHYRSNPAWRDLTEETFASVRAALLPRFGLADADLRQDTVGRGRRPRLQVIASEAFLHRAWSWQVWHRRSARTANGLLTEDDLRALGALPRAETTDDAEAAQATTAGDTEAHTPDATPTPSESPIEENPYEDDMRLMRRAIHGFLTDFNRTRSITPREARDARRAELSEPWEGQLNTYRAQLDAQDIDGFDTNLLNRRTARGGHESVANWARRWVRSIDGFLAGETTATDATGAAETVRGTAPVSRPPSFRQGADVGVQTVEQGRAWLEERDLVVREERIEARGWDPRLNHAGGADEPVQDIAHRAVPMLQALKTRLERAQHDIDAAVTREDDADREHLRRAILDIAGRDFTPPPTVRQPWRMNLRMPSRSRIMGWNAAQVLSNARQLRNRLRNEARRLVPEIRRNAHYQGTIHMVNPHGVVVDLHRSGVDVCWGEGTPMEVDLFHLDPVFAVAMFRYLETLRGMGVTKLWTSGFLRPHGTAISVLDAHPRGMACDITGFQFGSGPDSLIHLRGGYPMEPGNTRYDHWQRGHSDWYDERATLNGRTHREIMLGMAEILPRYFGRIIGPGHNQSHMNHFHVELFGNTRAGPALRAVSEYEDMPEWTHARANRLDPEWRTGGRPPE